MTTALSAQQALSIINEAKAHGFIDSAVPENDAQKIEVADDLVKAASNAFKAGVKAPAVVNILKIAEGVEPEVAATNPFLQQAAAPAPEPTPAPIPVVDTADDELDTKAETTPPWEGPDEINGEPETVAPDAADAPQAEFNRQCKNQGCPMSSGHTFMSNENCAMCGQPTVANEIQPADVVEPQNTDATVTNVAVEENAAPSFDEQVEFVVQAALKGHTVMASPEVIEAASKRYRELADQAAAEATNGTAQGIEAEADAVLETLRDITTPTTEQQLAAVEAAGTGSEAPKRTRRVRHPETGDLITKEERDEYLRRKAAGEVEVQPGTEQAIPDPHPIVVPASEALTHEEAVAHLDAANGRWEAMTQQAFEQQSAMQVAAEVPGPEQVDHFLVRPVGAPESEAEPVTFQTAVGGEIEAVGLIDVASNLAIETSEIEAATDELTHAILENGELNAEEAIATQQPIRGDFLGKRYRETELAQAAIAKANLPIPQDIEGNPLLLPSDFTTVDDVQIRRLHSSYHTYLARANWLLACEESDLDAAQRLHDRRYYHVLSQLERAEGKNQERVTLLKAEASADDEVAKWRETIAEHSALVRRLKVLRDHYEGTCTRLSREWTMRTGERDTAGGLKRAA